MIQFDFVGSTARCVAVTLFVFVVLLAGNLKSLAQPVESGYLYVLNDCSLCENKIFGYTVNEGDGTLALIRSFPTGGEGSSNFSSEQVAIDRKNLRLFVLNTGSKTVSAFRIDPRTGSITSMFDPFILSLPNSSNSWTSIAAIPSGSDSLVVVGDQNALTQNDQGRVVSIKISAGAAGTLGMPQSTGRGKPLSMAFSQDGAFIYAGGTNNIFAGFSVNATTGLATLDTNFPFRESTMSAFATDDQGRIFITGRLFGKPFVYSTVNGVPGDVPLGTTNPPGGMNDVGPGALHSNGFYAVSERFQGGIGVFKFNTGSVSPNLTMVPGSPFISGGGATSRVNLLAFNHSGKFLYAGNSGPRSITIFNVDPETGVLTTTTERTIALNTPGALTGIAYLPPFKTTTTINAPAITFDETGSATVKVTSAAGTISGSVTLSVDGGAAESKVLNGGSATFTLQGLNAGDHPLAANFPAQGLFSASNAAGTLLVNKAATTMSINAPDATLGVPTIGQTAPVTVTVNSSLAGVVPTGTVTLSVDSAARTTLPLIGGSATFNVIIRGAGIRQLRAEFPEQAGNFAAITRNGSLLVKGRAAPVETRMTITAPAIWFGFNGSVFVTVSSANGIPAGKVSLTIDGRGARTKVLTGGKAVFIVKRPRAGEHRLLVSFTGTAGFKPVKAEGKLFVKFVIF